MNIIYRLLLNIFILINLKNTHKSSAVACISVKKRHHSLASMPQDRLAQSVSCLWPAIKFQYIFKKMALCTDICP